MTEHDETDEERDDLARALNRALRRRKKPRGLGASIAAALAAGGPLNAPEAPADDAVPPIPLNADDVLKARVLGAMTNGE